MATKYGKYSTFARLNNSKRTAVVIVGIWEDEGYALVRRLNYYGAAVRVALSYLLDF